MVPLMGASSRTPQVVPAGAESFPQLEVRAAGGVIWKVVDGGIELAIVYRPKYRDWTFPKGKVEPGETDEQTAHREVLEETGFDCILGRELPSVTYLDSKSRSKLVRYWEMTIASGSFFVNDEVDELRWCSVAQARRRLTHAHDTDVLDAFARLAGL
jgi:8-oxo-dGTP diphosphatase